jgi:hypothetical protein
MSKGLAFSAERILAFSAFELATLKIRLYATFSVIGTTGGMLSLARNLVGLRFLAN